MEVLYQLDQELLITTYTASYSKLLFVTEIGLSQIWLSWWDGLNRLIVKWELL